MYIYVLPVHATSVTFRRLTVTHRYVKNLGEQTEQLLADYPTSFRPPGTRLLPIQFISGNDLTVRKPLHKLTLFRHRTIGHAPILHHPCVRTPLPHRAVTITYCRTSCRT